MSINHRQLALEIAADAIMELRDLDNVSISEMAEPAIANDPDIEEVRAAVNDIADQLDALLQDEGG
jgi:hypothetical protein